MLFFALRPYWNADDRLRVLEDWCPSYSGYHLYFPRGPQSSPAFTLLVDALRYRS